MTITYRSVKGSALTHNEVDGNFTDLDGRAGTVIPWGAYASLDPADATTYYLGRIVPTSVAALSRVYIPRSGTVVWADLSIVVFGTLGSNQQSTVSFRRNNTTDTTISSVVTVDAAYQTFSNNGLSIAVSAGDYFEIKWVTPTWTTNPTSVIMQGSIYLE